MRMSKTSAKTLKKIAMMMITNSLRESQKTRMRMRTRMSEPKMLRKITPNVQQTTKEAQNLYAIANG